MKPYSILIHGTGTCGEGNEQSADIALQKLLEQLRTAGHNFTSVSMVIDGSTVPIIGPMQPHPAVDAPASPDAVSLASIARQLVAIDAKCDTIIVGTKKEGTAPVPAPKAPKEPKPKDEKKKGPPEGKTPPAAPAPAQPPQPVPEAEEDDGAAGEPQPPDTPQPAAEEEAEEPTEKPAA